MKKILISDEIKGMAKDYALHILNNENVISELQRLKKKLRGNERRYIEKIIMHLPKILEMLPWEYRDFHANYFSEFDSGAVNAVNLSREISIKDKKGRSKTKSLYMWIVSALKYSVVQQTIFPQYIQKMSIRSCVYCNAQYAVSAKKGKTDKSSVYRSTYNLDHWKPKKRYPYLAVAFYNLYPCCPACNQGKSSNEKDWCMYANVGESPNPYKFRLDDTSLLNYLMTWDVEQLKIDFVDNGNNPIGSPPSYDYDKGFHIQKLYNNFKSEVEEVIWRKRIYNQSMVEAMQQSGVYAIKPRDVRRFIIGNYDRESDIMKRPLAKLVQDIAKQIGLI